MRRAAEQDVLGDGQLRRRLGLLRDEGDEARERSAPEPADILLLDANLAVERDEPGEGAERGRLPGAVRADERRPSARLRPQRKTAHRRNRPEAHPEVARLDHRMLRDVRRTTAKNGAPKNAVTTPIGSSAGERSVRASTSASTRKPAPARSESGINAR